MESTTAKQIGGKFAFVDHIWTGIKYALLTNVINWIYLLIIYQVNDILEHAWDAVLDVTLFPLLLYLLFIRNPMLRNFTDRCMDGPLSYHEDIALNSVGLIFVNW